MSGKNKQSSGFGIVKQKTIAAITWSPACLYCRHRSASTCIRQSKQLFLSTLVNRKTSTGRAESELNHRGRNECISISCIPILVDYMCYLLTLTITTIAMSHGNVMVCAFSLYQYQADHPQPRSLTNTSRLMTCRWRYNRHWLS